MSETQEFNWHMTKHNCIDILKELCKQDDNEIYQVARELCEKVNDFSDENMSEQDFKTEIQTVLHESIHNQLKTL